MGGNGIGEPGEDCDGGQGCNGSCKLTWTAQQLACVYKFAPNGDACATCSCVNCTTQYLACRDSGDATADSQCNAVLTCTRQNNCTGTPCYCTDPNSLDC